MQRIQPRELVAAGVCAALPAAYWCLATWAGGPDVLDSGSGGGAVVATAIVREWLAGATPIGRAGSFGDAEYFPAAPLLSFLAAFLPLDTLAATRAVVAGAWWVCGYGGYRLARTAAPGSGLVGGYAVALGAQIAAGRATLEADLPAFTAGFLLLALAHAGWGWVVGAMGLPAASAVVTIGFVRRRPGLIFGAVGLAALWVGPTFLPGSARRSVQPVAIAPAYGTAAAAWFPMPPAEAELWQKVEGRSGQWLSPSAVMVGVRSSWAAKRPGTTWRDQIEEKIDGSMPLISEERRAIGRGTMVSPLGAVLVFLILRWCERRKWGRFVPLVALALATAGGMLVWLREVRHDEGVSGRELAGLVDTFATLPAGDVLLIPPPKAPYFAGRLSDDRWAGVLAAAGRRDAAARTRGPVIGLIGELSRLGGYGLDVQAAERLWAYPPQPHQLQLAARADIRLVIIDQGAISREAYQRVAGWLSAQAVVPVATVGELTVFDLGE